MCYCWLQGLINQVAIAKPLRLLAKILTAYVFYKGIKVNVACVVYTCVHAGKFFIIHLYAIVYVTV